VLSSHSVHGLAEGWGCGLVVSDGRVKKFGLEFAKDGMDLRLNSYGCWWSGVYAAISLAVATEIDLRKFSPSASPPLLPPLLQRLSFHQVDRRAGNCPGDPVIIFVSLYTTSARKGISPNPPAPHSSTSSISRLHTPKFSFHHHHQTHHHHPSHHPHYHCSITIILTARHVSVPQFRHTIAPMKRSIDIQHKTYPNHTPRVRFRVNAGSVARRHDTTPP
jgi:hypothetical protein